MFFLFPRDFLPGSRFFSPFSPGLDPNFLGEIPPLDGPHFWRNPLGVGILDDGQREHGLRPL